jgi:hypothetical protein
MPQYVRDAGVWKPAGTESVRDAGVWKPAKGCVRDAGVWKPYAREIGFVSSATQDESTTLTLPSHQSGDLIILFAGGRRSDPAIVIPGGQGWLGPHGPALTGANSPQSLLVHKIAASSSETVGVFTNARSLTAQVYSGASGVGNSGGWEHATFSTRTITYPAIALQDGSGRSWIAAFSYSFNKAGGHPPAPDLVGRELVSRSPGLDTNQGWSVWTGRTTEDYGTNTQAVARCIEII